MKFAVAVLMVAACTLAGNYFTTRDINRVKTLEQILIMIQIISAEISFRKTPVNMIISKLSEYQDLTHLQFISECKNRLDEDSFPVAWKKSVNNSVLNQSDKQLLLSLGNNLGTSDVEGQLSNCELHSELFENNLAVAREKCSKFGKLYTSLGVLSGFLIATVIV